LWMAAGLLWIMDASINVSMEPFRAFVGDMLPSEQRTTGFAMQSFFIGTGAVVASALPWIFTNWFNVSNEVVAGERIPQSVKLSFYLGGAIFLLAVIWTVFSTKEYPPEDLAEFEAEKKQSSNVVEHSITSSANLLPGFIRNGLIFLIVGILGSLLIQQMSCEKELYVLSVGLGAFGVILLISAWYTRQGLVQSGLVEVMTDLMNMPKTMKQLAIVQFFSWFALFAMWIYSTSAVTSHIYGTSDTTSALYNEGANWVGVLFATYNGFAAVVAFLLPVLAKWTSRKMAHAIALICGSIGLASFFIVKDPHLLVISMLGVGVAWASILSMPYAILTGSLPAQKMGTYMGIFNFFIVIPQILAASILGFFTKVLFHGHAIYALILGGASLLIAAASVMFVDDVDQK
jgi:maltose/moltooligosaccharide transporter